MSKAATKNKSTKGSNIATGFLSHLIELRDRLLKALIVIGIAFVALFPFAKNIYNWLAEPLVSQGQNMLIIGPVAPFLIPMKLTLLVAFLIALPFLFYQLWSFVAPGLYRHEKRLVYPLLASSIVLFYLGIAFVYYLLLPMMFKIIPQFAPDVAAFSPDIAQYLDFTIMMFMAFGFGFEMPIATILLISTGLTTAEALKQKRPYVIVGAFIVGMLLTPPDVISQIMLAIPMWLLFELGLVLSKFFKVRIEEAGEARKEMDKSAADASSTAAAAAPTSVLTADKLWEDDDYTYEEDSDSSDTENTIHNEYSDDDAFDTGESISPEEQATRDLIEKESLDSDLYDDEYLPEDEDDDSDDSEEKLVEDEKFFDDNENFDELSDEEMEAELDRIEADEIADEIIEEKARKRAEAKKNKDSKKDT